MNKEAILYGKEKAETDKKEAPSILDEYNFWKKNSPEIHLKQPLSILEIAQKEGCELSELEAHIERRTQKFAADMQKECSYPDENYLDFVDSLYNLHLQAQNMGNTKEDDWLKYFKSYDDFSGRFCPQATPHAQAFIKKNIQFFTEKIVCPEKQVEIHARDYLGVDAAGNREIYEKNDWTLLPGEYYKNGGFEFTNKEVMAEVIDLIKTNYAPSAYTHATGSAALRGIEENKAILSAQEADKAGVAIKTGEHVSYVSTETGHPVAGGKSGLNSVYASKNGPTYYHHINWFDEYHVAFGINQAKQEDFLEKSGFKDEWSSAEEGQTLIHDMGSEGVTIGKMVPLDNVEIVYCWKKYQKEMEEWSLKNCPQAKIVSLEAVNVLKSCDDRVNRIALQEGISVEDAWKKFL